jgi:hypothetical protein
MYILHGKPDTYDTYASRASPLRHSYASCGQSPYMATIHESSIVLDRVTALKKETPDYIPSAPTDQFVGPYLVSLPLTTIEAVEKAKQLLTINYIGVLDPYPQHVISTFNICSWGPTHRFLTDTDGDYNLGGVGFPHHSLRPSQPTVLRLPLMAPLGLRLTFAIQTFSN